MVSEASEPVFIDSNILVCASEQRAPFHQVALNAIQRLYDAEVPLWISRQIIREYLATLTRPQTWGNPQSASVLIREVSHFESRFLVAEDGQAVTEHLLDLLIRFSVGGKQVHDAIIVATMLAHGVRRLLTNNVDDFARFAGVITIVPLV